MVIFTNLFIYQKPNNLLQKNLASDDIRGYDIMDTAGDSGAEGDVDQPGQVPEAGGWC